MNTLALLLVQSSADKFADKAIEWIFAGAFVVVVAIFAIRWIIDVVGEFLD